MKILFVSSEIYPFAKIGGLGDVAQALPEALMKQGEDVRLLLPGFPGVIDSLQGAAALGWPSGFPAPVAGRILKGQLPGGMPAYVIDAPELYRREGIYGDSSGKDWPDNHIRFGLFGYVAAYLDSIDGQWSADIIHGQDWLCGLMPAYLKAKPGIAQKSVLTIHNLAYQGLFPASVFPQLGLPQRFFAVDGLEFYGQVGFLKAGLYYADALTAVSPTYAGEIQQAENGCGLDGLLRHRSHFLRGIVNGIDTATWNPETDSHLPVRYGAARLQNKRQVRRALLDELGLRLADNEPLCGVVSRIVSQKGLDLLPDSMVPMLQKGAGLVVLGSGESALEDQLRGLSLRWPGQVVFRNEYNEGLAHRIIAGADAVLVPSRFEPCGLVQMYAQRYGTLPIVRKTGGLADTVQFEGVDATGFGFADADVQGLVAILQHVYAVFQDKGRWLTMQQRAMAQDFSWTGPAQQYRMLYQELSGRIASLRRLA